MRERHMGLSIILLCTILCLCSIVISGCGRVSPTAGIFEDNARIAEEGDTYTYATRLGDPVGTSMQLEYSGFSGVDTIWIIGSSKPGKLTGTCESIVDKGDFKVVGVTKDGRVENLLDRVGSKEISMEVPVGGCRVKVVGRDAKGKLTINLTLADGMYIPE